MHFKLTLIRISDCRCNEPTKLIYFPEEIFLQYHQEFFFECKKGEKNFCQDYKKNLLAIHTYIHAYMSQPIIIICYTELIAFV